MKHNLLTVKTALVLNYSVAYIDLKLMVHFIVDYSADLFQHHWSVLKCVRNADTITQNPNFDTFTMLVFPN